MRKTFSQTVEEAARQSSYTEGVFSGVKKALFGDPAKDLANSARDHLLQFIEGMESQFYYYPIPHTAIRKWQDAFEDQLKKGYVRYPMDGTNFGSRSFNEWLNTKEGKKWNVAQGDKWMAMQGKQEAVCTPTMTSPSEGMNRAMGGEAVEEGIEEGFVSTVARGMRHVAKKISPGGVVLHDAAQAAKKVKTGIGVIDDVAAGASQHLRKQAVKQFGSDLGRGFDKVMAHPATNVASNALAAGAVASGIYGLGKVVGAKMSDEEYQARYGVSRSSKEAPMQEDFMEEAFTDHLKKGVKRVGKMAAKTAIGAARGAVKGGAYGAGTIGALGLAHGGFDTPGQAGKIMGAGATLGAVAGGVMGGSLAAIDSVDDLLKGESDFGPLNEDYLDEAWDEQLKKFTKAVGKGVISAASATGKALVVAPIAGAHMVAHSAAGAATGGAAGAATGAGVGALMGGAVGAGIAHKTGRNYRAAAQVLAKPGAVAGGMIGAGLGVVSGGAVGAKVGMERGIDAVYGRRRESTHPAPLNFEEAYEAFFQEAQQEQSKQESFGWGLAAGTAIGGVVGHWIGKNQMFLPPEANQAEKAQWDALWKACDQIDEDDEPALQRMQLQMERFLIKVKTRIANEQAQSLKMQEQALKQANPRQVKRVVIQPVGQPIKF